jgi:hypothetical protein
MRKEQRDGLFDFTGGLGVVEEGVNRASLLCRRVRGHVTAIEREMKAENNTGEKEVNNI